MDGVLAPVSVGSDGAHVVEYRSTDRDGNVEDVRKVEFTIDTVAPVTTAVLSPAPSDGPYRVPVTLTLSASDAVSGVDRVERSVNGGAFEPYTGAMPFTGNGSYRVAFRAVDRAGHVETAREVSFVVAVPTNVEAPVGGTCRPRSP